MVVKARLLYQKAISQWGYQAQLGMAVEECLELVHAIMKFMRNDGWDAENIEEEVADVEIMMAQLRLIFNTNRITKVKRKKLRRLQRRLGI